MKRTVHRNTPRNEEQRQPITGRNRRRKKKAEERIETAATTGQRERQSD
jgi:hypothetical protein